LLSENTQKWQSIPIVTHQITIHIQTLEPHGKIHIQIFLLQQANCIVETTNYLGGINAELTNNSTPNNGINVVKTCQWQTAL
jgi:hypothetical protein